MELSLLVRKPPTGESLLKRGERQTKPHAWRVSVMLIPYILASAMVWAAGSTDIADLGTQCRQGTRPACDELEKIAMGASDDVTGGRAVMSLEEPMLSALNKQRAKQREVYQPLLTRIAVGATSAGARRVAVLNLTDQPLLAKVAMEDADAGVRCNAILKLTDEATVAKIGSSDADTAVVKCALSNVLQKTGRAYFGPARPRQDVAIVKLGGRLLAGVDGTGMGPRTMELLPGSHSVTFGIDAGQHWFGPDVSSGEIIRLEIVVEAGKTYTATLHIAGALKTGEARCPESLRDRCASYQGRWWVDVRP